MLLELFPNPPNNLPEYEHRVRWMYFFTGLVPEAYVRMMSGDAVSFSPGNTAEFLAKIQSPEHSKQQKQLEQECVDVAKKCVANYMLARG